MRILATLSVLGVCLSFIVVSARAADEDSVQERVDQVLSSARTKAEVDRFTNVVRTKCFEVTTGTEMCTWWFGNRSPAWQPLASAISTRKRIRLLCLFPLDGSPRETGSCTAHRPFASEYALGGKKAQQKAKIRKLWREEAQTLMDNARTLIEITRLIGDLPSRCNPISEDPRMCLWRTVSDTPGYKIVGHILGTAKKVRVSCRFPADGSPRAENSCNLEIGT